MSNNIFDVLIKTIDTHQEDVVDNPYLAWEPWDIEKPRDDWQIQLAMEDGVDLLNDEHVKIYGLAPRPFQSGIVFSEDKLNMTIAGGQSGKTMAEMMRDIASATGEFPYSMRYDKGVDTGIPRLINEWNIRRFGRRDSRTGQIIDYDVKKMGEWLLGNREWNCGNIVGAGKFPAKLIAPDGAKFWIGTTRRAYVEMWLPALNIHAKENCVVPAHFVDIRRGNNGYSAINQMVHFKRGIDFSFITYESGAIKFEAKRVFRIALDEEPPNREIFAAAISHCESLAIITTPYRGVTWLKEIIDKDMGSKSIWHCTQFDSPYQIKDNVMLDRASYLPHQRAARVWGVPVVQNEDRPFFHPLKLNLWMQRHKPRYQLSRFSPKQRYGTIAPSYDSNLPCLMDVDVVIEKAENEDRQFVWRVYEEVKKDEAYVLVADPAEGDEIPADAGDAAGAMIIRKPKNKDEVPQPVAIIRSTLLCEQFAEMCMHVARYYNNATLCPESKNRGSWNMAFYQVTKNYPYWYYQETERWSNRKRRGTPGFDTNSKTRDAIFKKIQEWEDLYSEDQQPNFVDDMLLGEMAGCISNQKGRPDHVTAGSLDLTVCWGIGLFVLTNFPEQFKNNALSIEEEDDSFLSKLRKRKDENVEFYQFARFR